MFDVPQQQKRAIERRIAMGQPSVGYGWPGMKVRWCTGQLKTHLMTKEVNRLPVLGVVGGTVALLVAVCWGRQKMKERKMHT